MKIEKTGDIYEVSFDYKAGQNQFWVLLMSDEHYDSIDCDRKLLKRHHEEAKEKNAPILKFGDVFDCMGGKYDPRTHKGDIRPEHVRKDYFDVITQDASGFYSDYPVAFVSPGNHEESVLARHETDLSANLARALNCALGDYSGYIRFKFTADSGARRTRTVLMYYDHGMGGNSPVTKGVISSNRRGVAYDADIFVSGHNHNRWVMEIVREYVDMAGNVKAKPQIHINTGTYLNKPATGRQRYASGFGQPNKGGVWLYFSLKNRGSNLSYKAIMA